MIVHAGLRTTVVILLWCIATLSLNGCVAVAFLVKPASLPDDQVFEDILYTSDGDADAARHVLDLYTPKGEGWPVMLFVHGGGWVDGDKDLSFAGREVYGNIGRYYASRGIGVAVQSYRLQPAVTWRDQIDDVARANAWLTDNIGRYGGDPDSIFLAGHSAGAQLVVYAALAEEPLRRAGGDAASICGVIGISGAGYDLTDPETYKLGAKLSYYQARFEPGSDDLDWPREASATTFLEPNHVDGREPPLLIFYAADEYPSIRRQAEVLHERASEAGLVTRLLSVPKVGHRRIVVNFSQRFGPLDNAVRSFVAEHSGCGATG